jgi:hypothetical protein
MTHPVIGSCGHSFDREPLTTYFRTKFADQLTAPCPTCKQDITISALKTNFSLKSVIDEIQARSLPTQAAKTPPIQIMPTPTPTHTPTDPLLIHMLERMDRRMERMERRLETQSAQIHNLLRMNFLQRVAATFYSPYMGTVMNRGISEERRVEMSLPLEAPPFMDLSKFTAVKTSTSPTYRTYTSSPPRDEDNTPENSPAFPRRHDRHDTV